MNENAYQRLGELLLDEILLRTGLAQTDAEPVTISLDFVAGTDSETETVILSCERINSTPLELRLPIRAG